MLLYRAPRQVEGYAPPWRAEKGPVRRDRRRRHDPAVPSGSSEMRRVGFERHKAFQPTCALSTTIAPFWITIDSFRRAPIEVVGSPSSKSRSASLPGATTPKSSTPKCSAASLVAILRICDATIPACADRSASSIVFSPNLPKPQKLSVPSAFQDITAGVCQEQKEAGIGQIIPAPDRRSLESHLA